MSNEHDRKNPDTIFTHYDEVQSLSWYINTMPSAETDDDQKKPEFVTVTYKESEAQRISITDFSEEQKGLLRVILGGPSFAE